MNAMIHSWTSHSKAVPFTILFKGIVGCGIGAVILIGAFAYLAGKDFTPVAQIVVGVLGAVAGGVGAYRGYSDH